MREYAFNVVVVFCHILKDGKVMLIKRGKPPMAGDITVIGGKKERGEDAVTAVKREVFEETGLTLGKVELKGVVSTMHEGTDFDGIALYFTSDDFSGEPIESEEGRIGWYPVADSYNLPDISDYYKRLTPLILGDGGTFAACIRSGKEGIREFTVY